MLIEGCDADRLAARFGTPLYVYSRRSILERFWSIKSAFRGLRPLICYAVKANTNRALCRLLAGEGAGADIVSGGELLRALAAGFPAGRIVFSGIGKTREELDLALRRGVLTINVESAEELQAVSRAARRLKKTAPVSVRLNPDVDAGTHPHITTGLAHNKFGVEEKEALALYRRAAADPWLSVRGVQCHIGSQITDIGPYRAAARGVARLVSRLAKKGIPLSLIDLGGGMGVGCKGAPPIALAALAAAVAGALKPFSRARLLLEPGRFLVADAGLLLTKVLYRKSTSSRRFVIVDAAMNDLARPALYGAHHPIEPTRPRRGRSEVVDVVGPICETGDFLARGRRLPPTKAGDLLAVLQCGAYAFSMSSQYNSRPRAAEVLVDGAKARLIRRRESLADLTRGEI
jgi:diaminopimelate decarboxylase